MRLTEYLEPELVLLDLHTTGVEDTLHALVEHLRAKGAVDSADDVERALVERERNHTTSLGNGVALPHAALDVLDRPLVLVAISPAGVEFGPRDDEESLPDRLFFLLLSPPDAGGTHIKMLARIVRLVRSPRFVETLVAAESAPDVVEAIAREDALHV
ncbi:MAG: PTS sugar transporter subunit IIA [Gemmatimonadota bacterium]|jgi:mannitol/fructose-specific phosphotransferase system IIA component (Ntr-type)